MRHSISIIVPCYNEETYISNCIESIVGADIDFEETEVFFVDGGSTDNTTRIIELYAKQYPFIELLHNSKKITPVAMNIGIEASSGEYLFIISAHADYPEDYFATLTQQCEALGAACVGGVLKTDVKNSTFKSNSIKSILIHRFGVGNATFRTGVDTIREVDTVAFGCYPRETFVRYGVFDEQLIRNQDIEFNKRIIRGGGKIYLIPEIEATYFARENFTALAKNNYANGYWNLLTAYYTKTLNSLSLRHFIPLIFVLSLILPLLFGLFISEFLWIGAFSLVSYLALVIIISFKLKEQNNDFFYLVLSFLTLHFSYGFGSLVGLFTVMKKVILLRGT
ncbi:MAG TPA: glycosyltransferase family 2 protein [Campylobacterales bacterium]|nr:glycosyltransferase family 2 protein [Campylobacterales bacterium]